MDFYTNIHKSGSDRGSSITASSDAVSRFNYSSRGRAARRAQLKPRRAPRPPRPGRGGGTGDGEHYLLEVFKFIARMMFLISTTTIN